MKLRDHYLIAWLSTKGYSYEYSGEYATFNITYEEFLELNKEYSILKPLLTNVRKVVKELNAFRAIKK